MDQETYSAALLFVVLFGGLALALMVAAWIADNLVQPWIEGRHK